MKRIKTSKKNKEVINRSSLLNVLGELRPGLTEAKQEVLDQSSCFIFKGRRIYTYNEEIMVSVEFESGIKGSVPASPLYELLKRIKEEDIEFEIEESYLKIAGKSFDSRILMEEEVRLPIDEVPLPNEDDWKKVPRKFTDGLYTVQFSVDYTSDLGTACVYINSKENCVESTDDYRITRYNFDKKRFAESFLIKGKTSRQLLTYPIVYYCLGQGWAHFKTDDNVVFSCRRMEGEFPDIGKVMEAKWGEKIKLPNEKLVEALSRASVMSKVNQEDGAQLVKVSINEKDISVLGEGDLGWFKEKMPCEKVDKPFSFVINLKFFIHILQHAEDAEIDSSHSKIRFSGEDFVHVIALIEENE